MPSVDKETGTGWKKGQAGCNRSGPIMGVRCYPPPPTLGRVSCLFSGQVCYGSTQTCTQEVYYGSDHTSSRQVCYLSKFVFCLITIVVFMMVLGLITPSKNYFFKDNVLHYANKFLRKI